MINAGGSPERATRVTRAESVGYGIVVTAIMMVVARGFGLAREIIATSRFGPSRGTDATYLALTAVTTVTTVFSLALPPAITRILYSDQNVARRHAATVRTLQVWLVALSGLTLLIIVFARPLGKLLIAGDDLLLSEGVTASLRFGSGIVLFQGLAVVLTSLANAEGHHTAAATSNIAFPCGTVAGIAIFGRRFGPDSILLGADAALLIQVVWLGSILYSRRATISPEAYVGASEIWKSVRALAWYSFPLLAGVSLLKLDSPLLLRAATRFQAGDAFVLAVTTMLVSAPITVTTSAVSRPTVPELVVAGGDEKRVYDTYSRAVAIACFLVCPASVIFMLDGTAIINLLFRHGHFGSASAATAATATAVWGGAAWFLALSLYYEDVLAARGFGRRTLALRAFYVPTLVAALWVGGTVDGLRGVVIGYVVANFARFVALGDMIRRALHISPRQQWAPLLGVLAAAATAASLCIAVDRCAVIERAPLRLASHLTVFIPAFFASCVAFRVGPAVTLRDRLARWYRTKIGRRAS